MLCVNIDTNIFLFIMSFVSGASWRVLFVMFADVGFDKV